MALKLGKVVHLITPCLRTKCKTYTSFISQRALDLKHGVLVYIITKHVHEHFQVSIALHYENMADFVISY